MSDEYQMGVGWVSDGCRTGVGWESDEGQEVVLLGHEGVLDALNGPLVRSKGHHGPLPSLALADLDVDLHQG